MLISASGCRHGLLFAVSHDIRHHLAHAYAKLDPNLYKSRDAQLCRESASQNYAGNNATHCTSGASNAFIANQQNMFLSVSKCTALMK